jgi:small ligand-binding sensory domain FIST
VKAAGALVLTADPREAASRAVREARASLGGLSPSLAVLFASAHFFGSAQVLLAAVAGETGPIPLIGCVSEGVAGGAREVESGPAVSLWLAAGLGPVETFAMEYVRTSGGGAFGGYRFERGAAGIHLMICDPFTFPAADLLAHLNEHVPGAMVMGGMASGGLGIQQSRLFLDGRVLSHGAVGAHLAGAEVHPLVAQGCRPVGHAFTTTRADGNLIFELGGRPPLARLRELATALPVREQELLARGAHVGIVIDEYQVDPRQGDFLIRGIIGADPESGAIAVGEEVEVGQTVQFHVRDAQSADDDLRRTLERECIALGDRRAAGALLFTCNGRGSRMFTEPDHDARLVAEMLGGIPMAGFFCAGELGPVGGQNFLHTFTASIALFPETALPDGLDLRGLGDQTLPGVVQAGLDGDRGAAAVQRYRHGTHGAAADRPEHLAGRGDRRRRGAVRETEERDERSRGVGQGHQDPAVHDAARGAQVRCPGQPHAHPVGAGLVHDQAEMFGERHEWDQRIQVSRHEAQRSPPGSPRRADPDK